MYRKIVKLIMVVLLLCAAATAGAVDFSYVNAGEFKDWLNNKKPLILADIQKSNSFKKHHFYGALETNASPAKTGKDTAKLDFIVRMFQKTGNDVVIIGSRGGPKSRRAAKYLVEKGIPTDKIFILDGGVNHWPDQEMLLDIAGGCA